MKTRAYSGTNYVIFEDDGGENMLSLFVGSGNELVCQAFDLEALGDLATDLADYVRTKQLELDRQGRKDDAEDAARAKAHGQL